MSVAVKYRRDTAAFLSTFVGAKGEILVDLTNYTLQVHDGVRPGGNPLAVKSDLDVLRASFSEYSNTTNQSITDIQYSINVLQTDFSKKCDIVKEQQDVAGLQTQVDALFLTNGAVKADGVGSFRVTDAVGFAALDLDSKRLLVKQALADVFDSATFSIGKSSQPGTFRVKDPLGFVGLDFDGVRLAVAKAAANVFDGPNFAIQKSDPGVTLLITDAAGYGTYCLSPRNGLQVAGVSGAAATGAADYSAIEIAERSARAMAVANNYRMNLDTTVAGATFAYNHFFVSGQSNGSAQEAWPAKTLTGRPDVLMIGQSTRPGGGNASTNPAPLGDTTLRPAIATVQGRTTGTLISASDQAALAQGNDALGEDPLVSAMIFARKLFLQKLGQASAADRLFVGTNIAVSGQTIEAFQKGASPELFNRLRAMATAVKTAAGASSYGICALIIVGHDSNYNASLGGTTDKAAYKALVKQFVADWQADVVTGIAGQSEPPVVILYQPSGQVEIDAADLSIGAATWELTQENPGWYLACPDYPVPDKVPAGPHLTPNAQRWLGLMYGKVFHETVVLRRRWKPLSPLLATIRGQTILADFHVPCAPLQFQSSYVGNVATDYVDKGFTVKDNSGVVPLAGVTIAGDATVKIALGRPTVGNVYLYYGLANANGGGNLCDSDPLIAPYNYEYTSGSGDYAESNIAALVGKPYPLWNWCIGFKILVTAN